MPIFDKSSESSVTRAIISQFAKDMDGFAETDVIIIGGGPSGLMAARDLAKKKVRVLVVERNNYLGGGFWIGGFLMNTLTIRAPAQKELDDRFHPAWKDKLVRPGSSRVEAGNRRDRP